MLLPHIALLLTRLDVLELLDKHFLILLLLSQMIAQLACFLLQVIVDVARA